MSLDISFELLAPVASAVIAIGANIATHYLQKWLSPKKEKTYGERLQELISRLSEATRSVDAILGEVAEVAKNREASVNKLESELHELEAKERQMQERLQVLSNTPIPVAEHFAEIMKTSEKSSARRDYLLFGAGVVVSTVIAILLKLFGWG